MPARVSSGIRSHGNSIDTDWANAAAEAECPLGKEEETAWRTERRAGGT